MLLFGPRNPPILVITQKRSVKLKRVWPQWSVCWPVLRREVPIDPSVLPEVSREIRKAQAAFHIACSLLRENGFPECAADLSSLSDLAQVWVKSDGILHIMAQSDVRSVQ